MSILPHDISYPSIFKRSHLPELLQCSNLVDTQQGYIKWNDMIVISYIIAAWKIVIAIHLLSMAILFRGRVYDGKYSSECFKHK